MTGSVITRFLLLILTCLAALPAAADPPGRVGRVSFAEGPLSLRHADSGDWVPAGVNYPLIGGDTVWVDPNGRAEIEIGGAEVRLDRASALSLLRLDDQATMLRLDQGALNLTVRFLPAGGLQVITAVGQFDIFRPGEYHVDVGRVGSPPTQLVMGVLSGEARFSGARGISELHSGQGAMVPPDQTLLSVVQIYPTPFDQWAEDRAASMQLAQTAQYVSPDVTGYQDLGGYGRWEPVPDYGMVWFPASIAVGWAPYRFGHWAFVPPWGWTWIDDAPWGFAPFHYGRWSQFDGRWAWIPGVRGEPHPYAPALVAFIGGTPGASVTVGIGGGIGWVPLGPHEAFHPYYPASNAYLMQINRAHVTNVAQISVTNGTVNNYVNHGAVTSVSNASFTGGQAVHQNLAPTPIAGRGQPPAVLNNLNHLPPPVPAAAPPAALPPAAFRGAPASPAAPVQPYRPAMPAAVPPAYHPATPAATAKNHPAPAPEKNARGDHVKEHEK